MSVRPHKRSKPPKAGTRYQRVWKIVNGAVADALKMHPDYLAPGKERSARESIVKRVTGAVIAGFPETGRAVGDNGG